MILPFVEILKVTHGRVGVFDGPCFMCSVYHNPKRKVFRVWAHAPSFASFYCARCGAQGWAREGNSTARPSRAQIEAFRQDAAKRQAEEDARQLGKAQWFWRRSVPPVSTPVETYLRIARRCPGAIPATLRYLPPSKPEHHPAMIAAFGVASEPEPGVLSIEENQVVGVHLTLISPDGRAKAGTGTDKLMLGRSAGSPIVLAPPNDSLGLVITEGIEDALSAHQATGLGAWAAGAASRLPALADAVPGWIDCITVLADADNAGQKNSPALTSRLRERRLTAETVTFDDHHEVAA